MAEPGDVTVINTLSIQGGAELPIIRADEQKGGFREVADNTTRDAIPASFRTEGMHVYNVSNGTTYRLGPGLGNGDWVVASGSSGAITGDHPVLENPATSTNLADFLDSNYRPQVPTASGAYTIYVSTSGDDATGDGSAGSPFATIQRATQLVASLNSGLSTATISLGAGSFDCPRVMEANYITFQGTTSVEDTLTIDTGGVIAADNTDGVVIDVTSTGGPYTADELRGRHIIWTSGTSNGNKGWVYRNDATVGGVTRLYATHDSGPSTAIESMADGDTITLMVLETSVRLLGATIFQNSVQFNWRDVRFYSTSSSSVLALSTDKIDFSRCYFDGTGGFLRRLQSGGFGRAFVTNCYYAGGGFSDQAFLALKNNGYLQIQRGTVLDAELNTSANPDRRYVEGSAGSLLAFQKHVVCRGFTVAGMFEADGLGIFALGGIGPDDTILVEDAHGTNTYQPGPVFKVNSTGAGQGGWYQLPNLHGSITGDYSVEAQNCACTIVGDGTSTLATNLGTNTVSADAGTSNIATAPDLTLIENGSPDSRGFKRRTGLSEVTGTSYTVGDDEGVVLVNQTADAAVSITLPAGATHLTGEIIIKDKKGTASARNITLSANGAETIDGSGTSVINIDYGSRRLIFSGTEWSIV